MRMDELMGRFRDYIRANILPIYGNPNGNGYNFQGCANKLNEFFETDGTISAHSVETFFDNNANFAGRNALWIMLGLMQIHEVAYSDIFPAINVGSFLDDDGYFQTYHGIMYPRNSGLNTAGDLRYFELTISRGRQFDPPSATLFYKNKVDENRQPENRLFSGTPVLSPKNDIVSILFRDDNLDVGTFFHFYFSYHMVHGANLGFKRGFVVTALSDEGRREVPVVLNFIMRNWPPIDSDTLQSYPGLETLLQHANSYAYVPAEEFHAILSKSEYSDVSYLFKPDDPITVVKRKDLCEINEPKILADIKDRVSGREGRMNAYRCFLELKNASLSPTHATWEALYDDLFKTITGAQ